MKEYTTKDPVVLKMDGLEKYDPFGDAKLQENTIRDATKEEREGIRNYIESISSVVQPVRHDPCDVCDRLDLEEGDTLYKMSDWDGGIGFDYIHNIKFCPVCGRKLTKFL